MKCIVTHGDLDGLTSAAILLNALNTSAPTDKIRVMVAQPFSLLQKLERIVLMKEVEEVYILDIGVDPGTWKKTRYLLSILSKKTRVLWIDHHEATITKIREISEMGVSLIFAFNGSTATVMKRAFTQETSDPEFFEEVALMGEVGDKVNTVDWSSSLGKKVRVIGSALSANTTDDEFKISLVKMWGLKREIVSQEVKGKASESDERFRELTGFATERVIYSSETSLIVDLRDMKVRGYVGKLASDLVNKTSKLVFVLFNPNPSEVVATCRVPEGISFNAANSPVKIALQLGGSGGGHPRAASIRVPKTMEDKLVQALIDIDKSQIS